MLNEVLSIIVELMIEQVELRIKNDFPKQKTHKKALQSNLVVKRRSSCRHDRTSIKRTTIDKTVGQTGGSFATEIKAVRQIKGFDSAFKQKHR